MRGGMADGLELSLGERSRAVLDALTEAVVLHDEQGTVVGANPAGGRLLASARAWRHVDANGQDLPAGADPVRRALADNTTVEGIVEVRDGQGGVRRLVGTVVPMADGGAVASWRDATEEVDLREQLRTDPLTQAANRLGLADCARSMSLAPREVGVLFVDLDGFKAVNDAAGHEVGDLVLAAVAGRLHDAVRGSDLVVRYGGDEFVVIIDPLDDTPLGALVERICIAVAEPVVTPAVTVQVGASIGLAVGDGAMLWKLIDRADADMYRTKRAGRKVTISSEHTP